MDIQRYRTLNDVPKQVRDVAANFSARADYNVTVMEALFDPSSVSGSLRVAKSRHFYGQRRPTDAYADDGNTRVRGHAYSFYVAHPLTDEPFDDWTLYRHEYKQTIVQSFDFTARESDGKITMDYFAAYVGRWGDLKPERVYYTNHPIRRDGGVECRIDDQGLLDLHELVERVVRRWDLNLRLTALRERFAPPVKETT
jgi:hypothetical protein